MLNRALGINSQLGSRTLRIGYSQIGRGCVFNFIGEHAVGSTLIDRSRNRVAATLNGAVNDQFKNGRWELNFDGVDDFVSYRTPVLSLITISLWFKLDVLTYPNGHRMMVSAGPNAGGAGYISTSVLNKGGPYVSMRIGGVQRTLDSQNPANSTNSTVGIWYHTAVTWDGSNIKIYHNGILKNTSATFSGALSGWDTGTGTIGKYVAAAGYECDGKLADVRIYNIPLSALQINQIYNETKNLYT